MFREPEKQGIFLPPIEIHEHPQKGYICIAAKDIPAKTLIERCPTIKFSADALDELYRANEGRTIIHDYNFTRKANGYSYFAMGYGGIYSHSENPNARWVITQHSNGRATLDVRSIKDIKVGEEITHRYVSASVSDLLWFDPVE